MLIINKTFYSIQENWGSSSGWTPVITAEDFSFVSGLYDKSVEDINWRRYRGMHVYKIRLIKSNGDNSLILRED